MKIVLIFSILLAISGYCYSGVDEQSLATQEMPKINYLSKEPVLQAEFEKNVTNYFLNFPTIETQRLTLRPLIGDDAQAISVILYANRIETEDLSNLEKAANWISARQEEQISGNAVPWAIIHKETNQMVGFIGLGWLKLDDRRAKITRGMHEISKGKDLGIFEEALDAVLKVAFNDLQLNKVTFRVVEGVTAKDRLENMGFTYEGRQLKHCRNIDSAGNEFYQDLRMYSMLSEDYFAKQEQENAEPVLDWTDSLRNWVASKFLQTQSQQYQALPTTEPTGYNVTPDEPEKDQVTDLSIVSAPQQNAFTRFIAGLMCSGSRK